MMKNRVLGVLLFLTCVSPSFAPSYAMESLPEFQSLDEAEQEVFEGPSLLGAEYQSDILSYQKPTRWEYLWLSNPYALDLSAGSVNASNFMIDQRLKLRKNLAEHLEFRFTQFQERNQDRDSVHAILELVIWPSFLGKKVGISLYGEPSLHKREDDTGIALIYKPSERHEIRLFNTFVDVTRIKRNDRSDTYIEPDVPSAKGLVGRMWSDPESRDEEFLEYAIRHETKTRWLFPDYKYEYDFWRNFASLWGRKKVGEQTHLNLRAQFDRKFESQFPTDPSSAITYRAWTRDRVFVTPGADISGIGPGGKWEVSASLQYAYRQWKTEQGDAWYQDVLPDVNLKMPAFGEGATEDQWSVGVGSSWHRSSGPESLFFLTEERTTAVDHRLNLGYEFRFGGSAFIRLFLTADLDRFGSKGTWEGGNGQLLVLF